MYYFYFIMRRLIYILTLIYLPEYPIFKLIITFTITIVYIVWFINTKPLKEMRMNWVTMIAETLTLLVFAEMSMFYWPHTDS
jgi:hypothetical protein